MLALSALVLASSCLASAPQEPPVPQDVPWPDYRGPGKDGQVAGVELALTWNEEHNVAWKVPVQGRGWSSPVVAEGRVWLTSADADGTRLSVLAYDLASGEPLVERVLFEVAAPEPVNKLNSYASPSPVVGPGRVYVHFGTYGTACLEAATGKTLWKREDLHCDHMEGPGSSPFLMEERLILTMDGGDTQSLLALDLVSGKTLWSTTRSAALADLTPDFRKAYHTPIVIEVEGEQQLLSSGAQATYGYDPADGKELWRVRFAGFSMASRTSVYKDRIIVNTGFMRPELWCVRLGGTGDVSASHVLWRNTRGAPTMASNVIVEGRLFQVSDRGMASCIDLETGKTLWQERLGADHCASPIHCEGRIYFFDRDGGTTVIKAGAEFEVLAESRLDAGFMASPAVAGNALILRTETHLYRIEESD
ncbi:MAG: outer membrane protein assembly factor BamB [Planctomycetota bacterium]|jgi:outer membrane protein assembly factor BamB